MSGKILHTKAGCALLASLAIGNVHGASLSAAVAGPERAGGVALSEAGRTHGHGEAAQADKWLCTTLRDASHGARWASTREAGVAANVFVLAIALAWSWRGAKAREREASRILRMAQHDALTGLPNRMLTAERIEGAIRHAERTGQEVMVAFVDLDGFKRVNDTLGHAAGDELLRTVADRMAACLRKSDTVGRIGGDEFVLVLPLAGGADTDRGALQANMLEKVLGAVARPVELDGQEWQVSCSIGAALYPRDGRDGHALLATADAAMYRAKKMGKNNCQFHVPAPSPRPA